jgi:hypothetical protein
LAKVSAIGRSGVGFGSESDVEVAEHDVSRHDVITIVIKM